MELISFFQFIPNRLFADQLLFPREGYEAVVIIPIGHIADDCPRAEKKRKEMSEIVEEI